MSTVIKINNLSKKYIIGHQKGQRYTTLRDIAMHKLRSLGERVRHPLSINREQVNIEEFWALKDINFEVNQGDRLGIIGRNGAGKSTLLKILSRITEPTSGRISIKGRVAILLEVGTGMHQELTGRENIYLNGAILGMKQYEISARFDDIVDFSGCGLFVDTPIKRYSTGMRVRLGFAVAAFLDADILIVDEVLAVGDLQFQKKCIGKMEELGNEGRTILFVSHNMATMKVFCNKGIELNAGELTFAGYIDDVIKHYIEMNSNDNRLTGHYKNKSLDINKHNNKADLMEVTITDSDSVQNTIINVDQCFIIHIKWKLNIEVPFLRLCVEFTDNMGNVVLMTEDTDTTDLHGKPRKPGTYYQTVTIPPLLLMPKKYSINIFAGMPRVERLFEANHIIQFEITENNTHLSSVTGEIRDGYISTPLSWKVSSTDV